MADWVTLFPRRRTLVSFDSGNALVWASHNRFYAKDLQAF